MVVVFWLPSFFLVSFHWIFSDRHFLVFIDLFIQFINEILFIETKLLSLFMVANLISCLTSVLCRDKKFFGAVEIIPFAV